MLSAYRPNEFRSRYSSTMPPAQSHGQGTQTLEMACLRLVHQLEK